MNETQFREFTFENVVRMYTKLNPDFFEGTSVAASVKQYLAERQPVDNRDNGDQTRGAYGIGSGT
jgi:hypothetical protein